MMEIKDFPKGTKLREIFIYTCERIAEPLIPLGYKYRKSRNDIIKKGSPFTFGFYFQPFIRFSSICFHARFFVESDVLLQWRKQKYNEDDCIDSVIIDTITRLTRQNNDWKDYWVDTFMERERVIKEISDQINQYALPFFERFSNLEQLIEDVERDGFLPHRKKFEKYRQKRNMDFVECFREYCNRSK
ncbi:DUF4304 domain-containing protein [Bacteroides uniformis]|uniref:DUF4304 domain-containing protein n=1 Tax=Bacteroides uniformis TaxID=820 RepID=UPI001E2C3216|nr:DUF4304 domain-containing protein [Bacteroides uniformis]MDC1808708.1 DUF4304 domain-containing protein [Bacteroides uniformis]